jgi:hypothetical protein
MMEFHFGDVIGMDYEPSLRLMLVSGVGQWRMGLSGQVETWGAIVLTDIAWDDGQLITVSPLNTGVTMIACRHQEEPT